LTGPTVNTCGFEHLFERILRNKPYPYANVSMRKLLSMTLLHCMTVPVSATVLAVPGVATFTFTVALMLGFAGTQFGANRTPTVQDAPGFSVDGQLLLWTNWA